jgi:hypothetical protein
VDDEEITAHFPAETRDLSLLQSFQTGSGALKSFYLVGIRGIFSGGKVVGV